MSPTISKDPGNPDHDHGGHGHEHNHTHGSSCGASGRGSGCASISFSGGITNYSTNNNDHHHQGNRDHDDQSYGYDHNEGLLVSSTFSFSSYHNNNNVHDHDHDHDHGHTDDEEEQEDDEDIDNAYGYGHNAGLLLSSPSSPCKIIDHNHHHHHEHKHEKEEEEEEEQDSVEDAATVTLLMYGYDPHQGLWSSIHHPHKGHQEEDPKHQDQDHDHGHHHHHEHTQDCTSSCSGTATNTTLSGSTTTATATTASVPPIIVAAIAVKTSSVPAVIVPVVVPQEAAAVVASSVTGTNNHDNHSVHDHDHNHGATAATKSAHVHGPACHHDHDGHNHQHQTVAAVVEAHKHGPSCHHDHGGHDHGHTKSAAVAEAHVYGPSCHHDHGDHNHGHHKAAAAAVVETHVHGPSCNHDHGGQDHGRNAAVVAEAHVHGPNCHHDHGKHDHIQNKAAVKGGGGDGGTKKASGDTKGRSRFYVHGICCSSEIPAIKQIIEAIPAGKGHGHGTDDTTTTGISGHMINVTTKTVYVDHDSSLVSAHDIANAFEAGGFHSIIEHDHAEGGGSISAFVTSRFQLSSSDWQVLRHSNQLQEYVGKQLTIILESINQNQKNNGSGGNKNNNNNSMIDMTNYDLDLTSMRATISHNAFLLSAHDIATKVSETFLLDDDIFYDYDTTLSFRVQMDGNSLDNKVWDFPTFEVATTTHGDDQSGEGGTNKSCCTLSNIITIISGMAWVISIFYIVYEPLNYVGWVSIILTFPPIALKAFKSLQRYRFDVNVLMAFAMVGACGLQEYMEAAAIGFLFSISDFLAHFTSKKAREALQKIVELKPESANLLHPQTKELLLIPVESVPIGALVAVKSGDKVPCDGIVVEGTSTVDESSLTGESRPIQKGIGDEVSGGTVNSGNTPLMVQTTSNSEESAVSRLVKLVEEAQANRSETEQLVDRIANVYTPVVLVAALCMLTIPWAFGNEIGRRWTETALVLIVAACPCALVISTPVSYVAGLAAAAQKGVLIKGGAHLEALAAVRQIYFDKTGTLTEGNFKMLALDVITTRSDAVGLERKTILEYLYLMEERAAHPLSIALAEGAKNEGVNIQDNKYELTDHNFMAGEGVEAIINGSKVNVGNERLFRRLDMFESLPESEKDKVRGWELMGATIGFMSIGDYGVVCSYCAADAVRPESKQVLAEFRKMGINIVMLTGDNRKTAIAIGTPIGLTEETIKSGLLPNEKLDIVCKTTEEFEARGTSIFVKQKTVLMCGDGVNDAPALAAANIGVAMGHGAALAMSTADVCLLDSSLFKLVYALKMGKAVKAKIVQNVTFSIAVKIIVVVFALLNKLDLMWAIVSDIGGMVVVTTNGMLLLMDNNTNKKKNAENNNYKEVSKHRVKE